MLWVPPGFAHGFLALEDGTDFLYKCTDFYAPEHERTLLWNDPAHRHRLAAGRHRRAAALRQGSAPAGRLAEAEVFP